MRKIIKPLLIFTVLAILIAGGFFLGIYLRIFDTQALNEEYGLHELPFIGEYFVPPVMPKDDSERGNKNAGDELKLVTTDSKDGARTANAATPKIRLTPEEIAKQTAEREQAEKKRVTKLARLYNDMKTKDAAEALKLLDTDLCIAILQRMDEGNAAKVLSALEPAKAAQLTQIMYEGKQGRVVSRDSASINE